MRIANPYEITKEKTAVYSLPIAIGIRNHAVSVSFQF